MGTDCFAIDGFPLTNFPCPPEVFGIKIYDHFFFPTRTHNLVSIRDYVYVYTVINTTIVRIYLVFADLRVRGSTVFAHLELAPGAYAWVVAVFKAFQTNSAATRPACWLFGHFWFWSETLYTHIFIIIYC